ncbi:BKACE family enzyme [Alicyclobacillus fastidiosus]|uniref:3-keto-5-aminohexanoate cleavage protein n=1 Tax=Alicyclobacillus fastidiosus TaxID=392011 RepID=A0ABV5AHQ2_9BACL|nr:3-keto-5-aminohexanoate cleavage protein [Alicyclobacillus fastidiosus]WEH11525.1 3-keto-5-aminohexanoate cleavage protein [Alicyclobacillus fastidiosus]
MQKLIITAAVTGGVTTRSNNPNLPITPGEIIQAALDCWNAGASIVHIHARENDGSPSQRPELYQEIMGGIRSHSDVIVNMTTTGWGQSGQDESRWNSLLCRPDMATFTPGSMNRKNGVMINSPSFVRTLAKKIKEYHAKPEIEIFDSGMVGQALKIQREGLLDDPLHFQFILGIDGGIAATSKNLINLIDSIPKDSTWSVAGIGKSQLPMNLLGIQLGGHIRTGFEDNVYYRYKELALTNAQLVDRLVNYSLDLGREIATPQEARSLLSIATQHETVNEH